MTSKATTYIQLPFQWAVKGKTHIKSLDSVSQGNVREDPAAKAEQLS